MVKRMWKVSKKKTASFETFGFSALMDRAIVIKREVTKWPTFCEQFQFRDTSHLSDNINLSDSMNVIYFLNRTSWFLLSEPILIPSFSTKTAYLSFSNKLATYYKSSFWTSFQFFLDMIFLKRPLLIFLNSVWVLTFRNFLHKGILEEAAISALSLAHEGKYQYNMNACLEASHVQKVLYVMKTIFN